SLTAARSPKLPGAWPGRLPGEQVGEGGEGPPPPPLPEGAGKPIVEAKCVTCHDTQRISRVRVSRERWQTILNNMPMDAEGSTAAKPLTEDETHAVFDYVMANFSETSAGGRPKPDPNSRLPRELVKGEAMKYVAVEYELPNNTAEPHEVTVDLDGN